MWNLESQDRQKGEGLHAEPPEMEVGEGFDPGKRASSTGSVRRLRSVVVATDLSAGGAAALCSGMALAKSTGAKLSVISVVEPPKVRDLQHPTEPGVAEWVDLRQDEIRRLVEQEIEDSGFGSAMVHVAVGDPAGLVAGFAGKLGSDLVIVGAHRLSSFERILAGSTGERIVQHARRPVMVATRDRCDRMGRILAAVDLSPHSLSILEQAGRMARIRDSELRVVFSQGSSWGIWRRMISQGYQLHAAEERERFEAFVQGSGLPGRAETIVAHGHPGRGILREARKWDADLIVVGQHRLRILRPTRLGRTTRHVLRHGDRSILVVPNEGN